MQILSKRLYYSFANIWNRMFCTLPQDPLPICLTTRYLRGSRTLWKLCIESRMVSWIRLSTSVNKNDINTINDKSNSILRSTNPSSDNLICKGNPYGLRCRQPRMQGATFSNYKHHNTAKGLVGISSKGDLTFVSKLYAGNTSEN